MCQVLIQWAWECCPSTPPLSSYTKYCMTSTNDLEQYYVKSLLIQLLISSVTIKHLHAHWFSIWHVCECLDLILTPLWPHYPVNTPFYIVPSMSKPDDSRSFNVWKWSTPLNIWITFYKYMYMHVSQSVVVQFSCVLITCISPTRKNRDRFVNSLIIEFECMLFSIYSTVQIHVINLLECYA